MCVSVKSAFVGIQNQDFNYVIQSITLHKTSCTYNTFLEPASFITVVSFVGDAAWLQLNELLPKVTHMPQYVEELECAVSGSFWTAADGAVPRSGIHSSAITNAPTLPL
jgi:hypothetical protein